MPGVTPYGMTHRDEVWGDEGDAEYHTTAHEERAEFYANATTIRDVSGKKATSDMVVGQLVCRYGRSSNLMTCNHEVNLLNAVTYDPNCPCFIRNLVRATNPSKRIRRQWWPILSWLHGMGYPPREDTRQRLHLLHSHRAS